MTSQPASQEEYAARKSRTLADEFDDAAGKLASAIRYSRDLDNALTALHESTTDDGVRGELTRLLRVNGIVTAHIVEARKHVTDARAGTAKRA